MKSARLVIVTAALMLIALPLVLLMVAWGYERFIIGWYERELAHVAQLASAPEADLAALGHRKGVEIVIVDADGEVRADSRTLDEAVSSSALGHAAEMLLDWLGAHAQAESLADIQQAMSSLSSRQHAAFVVHDSPSGHTLVFSHAQPLADGNAVVVIKASHRGVRQLLGMRKELIKLTFYQTVFALLVAAFLSRQLIRPLERLAHGAARFPASVVAPPDLLRRRDEIGTMARAFTELVHSLESRRQETVALAADLAHELKNPMATIATTAELWATMDHPSPQKREMVSRHVISSVERLKATVDELLALTRLEASLPDLPRERVLYRAWLEELLDEYRRDPRYAHFTLCNETAADVGEVLLVPSAWSRLLRNLLDNALIQPTDQPKVVILAWRQGQQVFTQVQDHGPGVSDGNKDKIFRRFFSVRPEGAPVGTGLGLSIVQSVAAAHGGEVTLRSTPGQGAVFEVSMRC